MATLAVTMIVKNEIDHLKRLMPMLGRLYDAIYITDTGSTDGSLEYLEKQASIDAGKPVNLLHFEWVEDFAQARNHALPHIKEDYWMWLDADDEIKNEEAFLKWKEVAMPHSGCFYVPYNYTLDKDKKPVMTFLRERVLQNHKGHAFKDFIHEGVYMEEGTKTSLVKTWEVNHLRNEEDAKKDKQRNISMLSKKKDSLSSRLRWYYAKELFDENQYAEAIPELIEVCAQKDLAQHDRVLAFQYITHAYLLTGNLPYAIKYAHLGLQIAPARAEFFCFLGDAYLKQERVVEALNFYFAAKAQGKSPDSTKSVLFNFSDCYSSYPKTKIAQIYFFLGEFEKALVEIEGVSGLDADVVRIEAKKAIEATSLGEVGTDIIKTEDIVITCPPGGAYEWDEDIYKQKGIGGSETAAVEMAVWLKKITGRCVKIFMPFKNETKVGESGVEYIPVKDLHAYFKRYEPALHIAWRHTFRLTYAPSYVWSHDLMTPGAENTDNYDKILCLSEWHRDYLNATQGVPLEKILVTRNGINPKRWEGLAVAKKHAKVIWPNSPDRGLDIAMLVMDEVIKAIPEAELHCFYGFNNMKKFGNAKQAEMLEKMISDRPYVKYHGNVDQNTLAQELKESEVWLYTANFLETYCITGLEALCAQAWPVIRPVAALKNTMAPAMEKGYGNYISHGDDVEVYLNDIIKAMSEAVIEAIKQKKYNQACFNPEKFSWQSVAEEWVEMFKLKG